MPTRSDPLISGQRETSEWELQLRAGSALPAKPLSSALATFGFAISNGRSTSFRDLASAQIALVARRLGEWAVAHPPPPSRRLLVREGRSETNQVGRSIIANIMPLRCRLISVANWQSAARPQDETRSKRGKQSRGAAGTSPQVWMASVGGAARSDVLGFVLTAVGDSKQRSARAEPPRGTLGPGRAVGAALMVAGIFALESQMIHPIQYVREQTLARPVSKGRSGAYPMVSHPQRGH